MNEIVILTKKKKKKKKRNNVIVERYHRDGNFIIKSNCSSGYWWNIVARSLKILLSIFINCKNSSTKMFCSGVPFEELWKNPARIPVCENEIFDTFVTHSLRSIYYDKWSLQSFEIIIICFQFNVAFVLRGILNKFIYSLHQTLQ